MDSDVLPRGRLYYIYSKWCLDDIITHIKNCMPSYTDEEYDQLIGPVRIDYNRGDETDRTLCLLNPIVYDVLSQEGFHKKMFQYDFRISEYEIRPNNMPCEGFSRNLYIPLLSRLDTEECRHSLLRKLSRLEDFNILDSNTFRLTFPVLSRRTGGSTGSAFIEFDDSVSLENRAITRLILHETDWDVTNGENYRVKCLWARDRTHRKIIERDHNLFDNSLLFQDSIAKIEKTVNRFNPY